MITNTQLLNELKKQLNAQNLTENQKLSLAMRYRQLLLDTLKVGDIIQGMVKTVAENSYVLEIRPHVQIPVIVNDKPQLDELMSFIVKAKTEGKLFISSIENGDNFLHDYKDMVDKVAYELKLPQTKLMKEIIFDFMNKQLPLNKNMLMKAYYFNKEYNIPTKVLVNLIPYEKSWTDHDLRFAQALRENGQAIVSNAIKDMISNLSLEKDLLKIFYVLTRNMTDEDVQSVLKKYVSIEEPKYWQTGYFNADNLDSKQPDQNTLSKEYLQSVTEASKASADEAKEGTQNITRLADKKLREILLKDAGLFKKVLLALYDKRNVMDIHQLKNVSTNKELEKIFNFSKNSKELLDALEKLGDLADKKQEIHALKENIKVIANLGDEGHHFIFPAFYHDQVVKGELYFLKTQKYKKSVGQNKENLYIVLALDMPRIEHIEIHMNKQGKEIFLTFHVMSEDVKKHMMKFTDQIEKAISSLGYQLKSILWGLLNNKEDEKQPFFTENIYEPLSHMDIKA